MTWPAPGIHYGVNPAAYHALDACSSSRLRDLGRSPAYCDWRRHNPSKDTEATISGSLVHARVLEPARVSERFALAGTCAAMTGKGVPCANIGSLVAGSNWYCRVRGHAPHEAGEPADIGLSVVGPDAWTAAETMASRLMGHPFWQALENPQMEVSVVWDDDGFPCRARADCIARLRGESVLIDVKVCRQAAQSVYPRQAISLWHPQQLAWYASAFAAFGVIFDRRYILAVHPEPPHEVTAYLMGEDLNEWAGRVVEARYELYSECVRLDAWDAGPSEIEVGLPPWAVTEDVDTSGLEIEEE